jgi:DNA polymerase alpha subunit A
LFDGSSKPKSKSKVYHPPEVSTKPVYTQFLSLNSSKSHIPRAPVFSFSTRSLPFAAAREVDNMDLSDEAHSSSYEPDFTAGDNFDFSPDPSNNEPQNEVPNTMIKDEHIEKISIAKTTKKLNVAAYAAPKAPVETKFKQDVVDYDAETVTAMTLAAIGSGSQDSDNGSSGSGDSSNLDPKSWLLKSPGGADANGDPLPTEEYINMYWLDACEQQGIIYLFGKVPVVSDAAVPGSRKKYVSCCVAVHGAERNLFVLPAADPSGQLNADGTPVRRRMDQVFQDVNKLLVPSIVPKSAGAAFKCKTVKRKYAFELDGIPRGEAEYLKIKYSARYPAPSIAQCQKNGSIEHIFGATSSPLELFMLKRGLMGPGWIKVRNIRAVQTSASWCKIEVGVESPKSIEKVAIEEAPPLVLMSVSMKTALNPATHVHEIISISGLVHTNVDPDADTDVRNTAAMKRFTFIRPLGLSCGSAFPPAFPHDLKTELQKHGGGVMISFPNERAMLGAFFSRIHTEDPDLIASHNLFGFEFDVLLSRSIENKINVWSKLGRLQRTKPPKGISDRDVCCGRVLCDTYKAAKEFLRETSYGLTNLSYSQLKHERVEVDPIEVPKYFFNSSDILNLMRHTSTDAFLVLGLLLKLQVVPLTKQLTNLSGNLWSRTMRGARAERIEYLLLHEFHALKYVLPEKKQFEDKSNAKKKKGDADDNDDDDNIHVKGMAKSRAKAAYAGGLVLEPKKGLYDTYILLLDFNSLYPSLIQEYNLCFTTIDWPRYVQKDAAQKQLTNGPAAGGKNRAITNNEGGEDDEDDGEDGEAGEDKEGSDLPPVPDSSLPQGVLPRVIKTLVDRRRTVKGLLKGEKDPSVRQQLDIRQKALKLTANSMYGCLGFAFSRFCARPIAALVTSKGREALQRTVDQATNQFGLDVIYGDTDSVMINTGSTDLNQVKTIGNMVKREVNKLYKSLELDIDGIFRSMLLLKKKKYAALVVKEEFDGRISYEPEMKGLDLVRRDWCPLSKDAGKFIVQQILSVASREDIVSTIHEFLTALATNIRNEDLARFVITKGLNKSPKDYPDCSGQAHLQVALAMLKANKSVNIGDHIPYVICMQVGLHSHSALLCPTYFSICIVY